MLYNRLQRLYNLATFTKTHSYVSIQTPVNSFYPAPARA